MNAAHTHKHDDTASELNYLTPVPLSAATTSHPPVVVFMQDKALRYTWVHSPMLGELANAHLFLPQAVLGKTDLEVHEGEAAHRMTALKQRVLDSGAGAHFEMALPVGGGMRYYEVILEPMRDDSGAVTGLSGSVVDITARKELEQALRRGEVHYHALFDALTEGFGLFEALCDEHGKPIDIRYLDINPKMEQWIGRPREQIVNHTVREVLPGIEEHWINELGNVAITRQPVRTRLYNHNTQRHYDMYAFSPLPERAAALFLDVTTEVRIHEDLRQANDRLRRTLESVTDAYYAVDPEWRFLEINPVAEREVFARPAAELLGRVMWEAYPGSVGSEFERQYRAAMTTGQPVHFEARSMLRDKWWETHVYPRDGRLEVYLRDITERKHTERMREEALIHTTELYETSRAIGFARTAGEMLQVLLRTHVLRPCHRAVLSVFEHAWVREEQPPQMSEVIACWDAAGRNDLTGQRRAAHVELWTRNGPVVIPDRNGMSTLPPDVRAYLEHMGTHTYAVLPLIARGEWFGLLSFHFPEPNMIHLEDVRYMQGLVDQAAVAVYNTRLLEAEAVARHEAERANELRLRFLAMISHELRTPLTSIKGFATTLLARDVKWDEESQQDFLATIDSEADKLTDMIDQLLDLSRLEAGSLRINPEPHQVADILVAAASQLGMLAQRHRLSIDLPEDLSPIRADRQRIAQVLVNLVGNATKYSPAGTPIVLRVQQLSTTGAANAQPVVQFDVIDQGPGIAPEDRAYVFEAFRRGSDERSRRSKGAGLGLAICKGLVEAHGGRIWLQDRPRPGATFSFTLPCPEL